MTKRSSSFQRNTIRSMLRALIYFSFIIFCDTRNFFSDIDLSTRALTPAATGFLMTGDVAPDAFGGAASTAGDIDNDGYDDIILGAQVKNSYQGAAYVIYGGEESSFVNLDFSTTTLDPLTTGFMITGAAVGDCLGYSVSTAGDINNDGYADILIGARERNNNQGAAYMIYGGPKSSMSNWDFSSGAILTPSTTGFMITGNGGYFGDSVSYAGDINNDGYDDIIIGAYNKNTAYVVYGGEKSAMTNIDLSSTALNPISTGFMITGNGGNFGFSVSTAGDIDNDGYDDIIIGAYGLNSNRGAAYVIYGGAKSTMPNIVLSTTTLDPLTTGFMIAGNTASDRLGRSVSTAGDINNDGYDDIIVAAPHKNSYHGAVYVIYGGSRSALSSWDFSSSSILDPTSTGFMVTGNAASDYLGWSVSNAGDLNNDGYGDIILGAQGKNSFQGTVYVIYGGEKLTMSNIALSSTKLDPTSTGFMIIGNATSDRLGWPVGKAGDINNDGYDDIIIGAWGKNNSQGAAYVIFNACPKNCNQCSSGSVCTDCKDSYLLYHSGCLDSCPAAAFNLTKTCEDCPVYCSSCLSQDSCQACFQGFTLSNSLCIIPPSPLSSSQQTQEKATQAISSAAKGISSVVCVGSVVAPPAALVSKIVQNTRYLNISVTIDLSEIYQTWNTDLISWNVPNVMSDMDHFEKSPLLFFQYNLDSPFLVNFWPTLLNIGIGFSTFVACILLQKLFENAKYEGWALSLVRKFVAGSFNFTLVQTYACLDDILFYLVLDAKTNPFNNFFSRASIICAIIFLALGCLLVWSNFWIVKKYQNVKHKGTKEIEAFNERNKYWELFYSDFNDDDLWTQSFFAILIIRSTLSSFLITVLYDYPLMQTIYLVILDLAIISFLYFQAPFNTLRGKLAQYYYETITLLVHLCTFILSLQDTLEKSSETIRLIFSTGIIYLNTALISGAIGFMFIEVYFTISEKTKAGKPKQSQNIAVQTGTEDILTTSEDQYLNSEIQRTMESSFGLNLESPQIMKSNFNTENSRELDLYPIQQRNQRIAPIFYRPMPRRLRQNHQKKRSLRPINGIHPARFVND